MLSQEFFQRYRVRQDNWSLDYGANLQLTDLAVSQENIEPGVEMAATDWSPRPVQFSLSEAQSALSPLCVVDGVRRLHQRLVLELDDGFWYGGMGSIATGALEIRPGQARSLEQALIRARVERFALFGGVGSLFEQPLAVAGIPIPFQAGRITEENSPSAPVEALHKRMREAEDALVLDLQNSQQPGLILVDGPLQYHRIGRQGRVVGFVKSQHTRYLPPELQSTLLQLRPGERTPLFAIGGDILSWYLNLGQTRLTDHALSGIVRLETVSDGARAQVQEVVNLANLLQPFLPSLATARLKDPRSPQNLVPIQALENALRRQMGSEPLIQHLLEVELYDRIQNLSREEHTV